MLESFLRRIASTGASCREITSAASQISTRAARSASDTPAAFAFFRSSSFRSPSGPKRKSFVSFVAARERSAPSMIADGALSPPIQSIAILTIILLFDRRLLHPAFRAAIHRYRSDSGCTHLEFNIKTSFNSNMNTVILQELHLRFRQRPERSCIRNHT